MCCVVYAGIGFYDRGIASYDMEKLTISLTLCVALYFTRYSFT
jgi:hypothetical protein